MKKLSVLFVLLWVGVFSFAQGVQADSLSRNITRAVAQEKETSALYNYVSSELQKYYGRKNFSDPQHKTGWYRVDNFLKWVKKNEPTLAKSTYRYYYQTTTQAPVSYEYLLEDFAKSPSALPYVKRGFWVYLGVRYLAEIYQKDFNFSSLVMMGSDLSVAQSGVMFGALILNVNDKEPIPSSITLGMHEGTHYLPLLSKKESDSMLSISPLNELATFYTQYNYGLPIKKEDASDFAHSVRDVRRVHALLPNEKIYSEYNSFIAGLVLNPVLTPSQVLTFQDEDFNSGLALWEAAISLLAAKNNRFMRVPQSDHSVSVTEENLVETARRFGFSASDVHNWKTSPATVLDLGDIKWDAFAQQKETVVLQKNRGQYIFLGDMVRVSEDEFLRLNFGVLADNPSLRKFYDSLFSYLPPQMLQSIRENFPVVAEGNYHSKMAKLVLQYEKEWNEAIIRALNDTTAQQTVLPKGYL